MYCKNCGEKLNLNSNFCTKCGAKVNDLESSKKVIIEDNEIKYQLKPSFNLMYKIFMENSYAMGLIMILAILLYTFSVSQKKEAIIGVLIFIAVIIISVIIKLAIEKMQYNNYQYNFYKTKMEYKDGFLDKVQKELKYKHVREVVMSETFVERIFGIGTITIYTNASSFRNGIFIHCVKNVEEQYKIIKQIIDEGTDI